MKKINYIIREIEPEATDFTSYFDDDGLTEKSGDYCNNLFIVAQSRNSSGFNTEAYEAVKSEIENLLEMYLDIVNKSNYAQYSSVGAMLLDYGLINNIHNTKKIKAYTEFFASCCEKPVSPYRNYYDNFSAHETESVAEYLTLKTGKKWGTDCAYGYCQGDYVEMVYCPKHYTSGVKHYGEIWLGAGKEFSITFLDETGEEDYTVYGYIVADCQARNDEDYKRLVCEWEDIPEDETELQMVDWHTVSTKHRYRTI